MNIRLKLAAAVLKSLTVSHRESALAPGAGAATRAVAADGRSVDVISRGEDVEILYAAAAHAPVYAFSVSWAQAAALGWFFVRLYAATALKMALWRWARNVAVDAEQRVAFQKWRKSRDNG